MIPCEVKEASGSSKLERVTIFNNKTVEEATFDVDALILQLGYEVGISIFKK